MKNYQDGGEAILEAFRNLDIDYVISSPGSEWPSFWEAMARQKHNRTPGPTYLDCGHETIAVTMAAAYTHITGRMQAVFLHAGVGLMHGAMGLFSATASETPMMIFSGESIGFGEQPNYYMEPQWYGGVSVGGPDRYIGPLVKKASVVAHVDTLYEQVIRAGEMAQREQKGPVYLGVPIEMASFRAQEEPGWVDWYDTEESQRLLDYQHHSYTSYLAALRAEIAKPTQ